MCRMLHCIYVLLDCLQAMQRSLRSLSTMRQNALNREMAHRQADRREVLHFSTDSSIPSATATATALRTLSVGCEHYTSCLAALYCGNACETNSRLRCACMAWLGMGMGMA